MPTSLRTPGAGGSARDPRAPLNFIIPPPPMGDGPKSALPRLLQEAPKTHPMGDSSESKSFWDKAYTKAKKPAVDKVKALDEEFEMRAIEFRINCNDGEGNPGACHSLGEWEAVVNSDWAKAAEIYSKNCSKKQYGASCFNLARLHLAGKGVERDDAKAAGLSSKACEFGHKQACYHSAILTLHGVGVKKDVPKACELLSSACSEGISESCYKLASIYLKGKDPVKRDPAKAQPLLLQACDRGWAPACQCLAVMYKRGDGPVQADAVLYQRYSELTKQLVEQVGGIKGHKAG